MAVCVLAQKNGLPNWCDRHNRYHEAHYASYAIDPCEKGQRFRDLWDRELRGEPTLPSMITRTVNYVASLAEHVANGRRYVLPQVRQSRWLLCEPCEHRNREINACSLCGCPLNVDNALGDKLSWEVSKCPVGKWAPDHQDIPALGSGWENAPDVWERFKKMISREKARLQSDPNPPGEGSGIVIAGGGKYFASAYCNIRLIRHHGCTLPIELWYFGRDQEMPDHWQQLVEPYGVTCINADAMRETHPMRILNGWELKPYAVQRSRFKQVLFLDADCFPMRDPTYTLSDPRFLGTGAVFQRDCTAFDLIKPDVLAMLGLPAHQMWDLESGAFLIDKQRWGLALGLTVFLCSYSDLIFKVVYGDKTTYALGALLAGQHYAVPPHPPGGDGWGLMQHWFDGSEIWQHRIHCKPKLQSSTFISPQNRGIGIDPLPWDREINTYMRELRRLLNETS